MGLKVTKVEMGEERKIITSMIVSTAFLSKIEPILEVRLFDSQYAKLVAAWVLEYYRVTKSAPMAEIEEIFRRKAPDLGEDETEMVRKFLGSISEEYSRDASFNVEYAKDNAQKWLDLQAIKRLQEKLNSAISEGNAALANRALADYKKLVSERPKGISITKDTDAIYEAINATDEVLFSMSGALGEIVGPICRGDFVGIGAPPKRGKSWMLNAFAKRAEFSGLKVLLINLEMAEKQATRRLWQMSCGAPMSTKTITTTRFIEGPNGFEIEPVRKNVRGLREWSKEEIENHQKKLITRSRGGELRVHTYPTKSFSVNDLKDLLSHLETYENWVPDVIVADYADIMRSGAKDSDERHKLNDIWQHLRGLAQEKHIAIITASQTGRETMKGAKDADHSDVSEDIRKIAHCTKFVLLNQTMDEKSVGIMRVTCPIKREGYTENDCALVLQCLDVGAVHIASKLGREIAGLERGRPFQVTEGFLACFKQAAA